MIDTRAALIARWAAASHRSVGELQSRASAATPPPSLQHLAAVELSTPGRYRLAVAATAHPSLWDAFWNWVSDRWNDLWRAGFSHAHVGRGGALALGDALVAVVAILLAVVAYRLLSALVVERRGLQHAQRLDAPPDATALYASACATARRGEYAQACTLLFSAAVATLSDRGAMRDDRSATVGELRRSLAAHRSEFVAAFDGVAAAFVAAAYAQRSLAAPDWERARASYARIAELPA